MENTNKKADLRQQIGFEDNTIYGAIKMSNTKFTINVHNNENTTENAVPSAYNCGRQVKSDNIIYTGSDLHDLRKSTVYRSKEYRLIEKFIKEVQKENYIREGESLAGSVLVRDNDEIYVAILISCGYEMRGVMRHVSRHKGNSYIKDANPITGTVFTDWVIPSVSDKGLMFPITFFEKSLVVPTTKTIELPKEEKAVVVATETTDFSAEIKAMKEEIEALKRRVAELEEENKALKADRVEVTPVEVAPKAEENTSADIDTPVITSKEIDFAVVESLMSNPRADFWNTIVCRKFSGAPVTQEEINSGKIDIRRDLVLKTASIDDEMNFYLNVA
ncbi:hypothetical protein FD680_00045 [Salmonella enterica]|nr:hypothetical protein [Salmonella enterica]EAV7825207.1 hypothetical protein [Salmonella enterica]EAX9218872.1 hypothetical protein [Salmonella enterica]EHL8756256.1 hypothetical protein [Salmonella enterica]EIB6303397.1 hypothetical protein [Salmonella enterica]